MVSQSQKKKLRQHLRDQLLNPNQSNARKAFSVGYGIFWGIFPLWGWQLAICIPTGYFFKLNVPLVVIAANISIPPMIPFILYASFMVGSLLVSDPHTDISPSAMLDWNLVGAHFYQYALGAVVLSVVAGVLVGFITYLLLTLRKNEPKTP